MMLFTQLLIHKTSLQALKDIEEEALQKIEEADQKKEAAQKYAAHEIEILQ